MFHYSTPKERVGVFAEWSFDRMSQLDVVHRAIALYDGLRDRLAGTEWWTDGVAEEFAVGRARLDTLRTTATKLPLSRGADELLTSYLAGPDVDDLDAAHAWITLLPDLMVDVMGAEKQQNARTLLSHWVLDRSALFAEPTWQLTHVVWSRLLDFDVRLNYQLDQWPTLKFRVWGTCTGDLDVHASAPPPGHRLPEQTDPLTTPAGNRQPSLALAA